MQTRTKQPQSNPRRRGHILVMFAITVTTLIAMLGLVIDGGLLMTSQRQAQNAADAAARACALRVRHADTTGSPADADPDLQGIANTYALGATYNNVPTDDQSHSQVTVNHPPSVGSPYAGNDHYVEVLVTYPLTTAFIQVVGLARHRHVTARAVAGYELESRGAGLVVLDPDPPDGSGLKITGTGTVTVRDGTVNPPVPADVYVFSLHAGFDGSGGQTQGPTIIGSGQQAAKISGSNTFLQAGTVYVSGGVNDEDKFSVASGVQKLVAGTESGVFDPFFDSFVDGAIVDGGNPLLVPTTSNGVTSPNGGNGPNAGNGRATIVSPRPNGNGTTTNVDNGGNISVSSGQIATLEPGIYSNISINGGDVTLLPGIYVLRPPTNGGGNILSISGGASVHGVVPQGPPGQPPVPPPAANVMFYNTGHDYDRATGSPDFNDYASGVTTGVQPSSTSNFRGISITGGTVNLRGLIGSGNSLVFDKILFYQRRANDNTMIVNADNVNSTLAGTFYAKWAELQLGGSGTYNFAIVVGRLTVSGGATININDTLPFPPIIQLVYLVE